MEQLKLMVGNTFYRLIWNKILKNLRLENLKQLRTKIGKLTRLYKFTPVDDEYSVPIINLSSYQELDTRTLRFGLDQCFVNKNKYIRRDIAVELEDFASIVDN